MTPGGGRLYGVGLGPGDPELVTLKAARLIAAADVVAYHAGRHGSSIARTIAADLIPAGVVEEQLVYPVTTGTAAHPGGYAGAMADFYEESAARLGAHLEAGSRRGAAGRGRPVVLRVLHVHARPAGRPVRDRGGAGRDVRGRRLGRRRAARSCGRPTC